MRRTPIIVGACAILLGTTGLVIAQRSGDSPKAAACGLYAVGTARAVELDGRRFSIGKPGDEVELQRGCYHYVGSVILPNCDAWEKDSTNGRPHLIGKVGPFYSDGTCNGSGGASLRDDAPTMIGTASRGCRTDELQTAANNVIWFLGDVQQGGDPTITGGVDDPFGCAYDSLCEARRNEVSEAEFRRTGGGVVSDLLTADTWAGPSVYVDRGLAQERPDEKTLDPELDATWVEIEATRFEHIDDRTIVSDSGETEKWRVDLVREDGDWRVCDFTPID